MKIALIAGTGGLPPVVAAELVATGRSPIICEMRGFPSDVAGDFMRIPFRIETLGTLLETLKSLGVTDICMAGAVQRPPIDPAAIDPATMPLVPRLHAAIAKGDDGTLREVIAIFGDYGFGVVGAHQLAPSLLPQSGVLTVKQPPDLSADAAAAADALWDMGQADLGQAVLVRGGAVIAREDARGTAALLADHAVPLRDTSLDADVSDIFDIASDVIGGVADWLSATDDRDVPRGEGAILFKAPKPGQVLEADMPVIGPDTAVQAAEAGLAGIVIEAGSVMVLDAPQVIATLDAHAMFLWVRS